MNESGGLVTDSCATDTVTLSLGWDGGRGLSRGSWAMREVGGKSLPLGQR